MPRLNISRDPLRLEVMSQWLEEHNRDPDVRTVLGLDLGTNCGYAYNFFRPGAVPAVPAAYMGQWDLSAGSYDSGAIRFVRLRQFLHYTAPALVAYEEPRFTPSEKVNFANAHALMARVATAAEFLGALKATLCCWCEEHGVPCIALPIAQIKKRATGKGNAGKEQMIEAANEAFQAGLEVEGYESSGADNVADAAWVCLLGQEQYGEGLFARGRSAS